MKLSLQDKNTIDIFVYLMSNTFGSIFRLTTFGESHGVSIGGVIDGFPAGFKINLDAVQRKLNLRRPGFSILTSERKEADIVEFLSGLISDTSSGAPISFIIKNKNHNPNDYKDLKKYIDLTLISHMRKNMV